LAGIDQARHGHQRDHVHEDWAVTLLAAAGEPDVKEKLKKGHMANGKTFQSAS